MLQDPVSRLRIRAPHRLSTEESRAHVTAHGGAEGECLHDEIVIQRTAGVNGGEANHHLPCYLSGMATADSPLAPFRVTLWVLAGLLAGAALQWIPAEPSPWRWLPFGVAYLIGGLPIAREAWQTLKEGRLSIDFLMGAAAVGAAALGEPFEGAILLFLFSLSNALEERALGKTRRAVQALVALRPDRARVLGDGADGAGLDVPDGETEERWVPVQDVAVGWRVRVRPGERIPVDGRVLDGGGEVDESTITGESRPVRKEPGDRVFASTILSGGALTVEVTHHATDTLLARIVHQVEQAQESRAPAQHFIDRFAHPYTLTVVLGTALFAILPPLFLGWAWGDAIYRAITLLVVASPCALIISTPAAILSGIANGARHGILFKGGAVLDRAGLIDTLAFDKTGTLTEGKPRMLDLTALPGMDDEALLRLAAGLEQDSEHHIAKAVLAAAAAAGVHPPPVQAFQAFPGEGVSGVVDGAEAWAGNEMLMERLGHKLPNELRGWVAEATSRGRSIMLLGTNGDGVRGAMAFGDALKPDAADAIRHLKYEGVRWITILSGDHPDAVRAVAAELGVDEVRAGLLPHEKVEAIQALERRSRGVAMVGDGVNDAPAMAASSLGIAMGAVGTDVAIETADVVLMGTEVAKVDYVLHLGRRARKIVRQNVIFSIGWMLVLVGVAATVGMPLALAVIAHEGSTLLVALNGLRLLGGGPHPPTVPRRTRLQT
jgi:Zn2+/Cd2+-exporting ATPase